MFITKVQINQKINTHNIIWLKNTMEHRSTEPFVVDFAEYMYGQYE